MRHPCQKVRLRLCRLIMVFMIYTILNDSADFPQKVIAVLIIQYSRINTHKKDTSRI